jgi:hypothetical protein
MEDSLRPRRILRTFIEAPDKPVDAQRPSTQGQCPLSFSGGSTAPDDRGDARPVRYGRPTTLGAKPLISATR